MTANYRFIGFIVMVNRAHYTRGFAFAAADAFILNYNNSASGPFFKRVTGAYFHARGVFAPETDDRDEVAHHTARRTHFDR